ncbi:MAG: V-type ATP synthase subunit I [Lewinellaceae bacterium]|nr:V-type ATP synthase subunit I [Lewinellaceae bacterium]MCB9289212.1 V-type ATP synthase subunit I [Lewinellaceae bacterium]
MKKYVFLVHHSDYIGFLNELQSLGVLHVKEQKGEPSEELLERIRLQKEIRDTLAALRHRIVTKTEGKELSEEGGIAIAHTFQELADEQENLQQEVNALDKEITFLKPWGNFAPTSLRMLEQAGLKVHFFTCPARKYDPAWEKEYPIKVINTAPPNIFFVAITPIAQAINIDAEELPQPEVSLNSLMVKREALKKKIDAIDEKLDNFTLMAQPALEKALTKVEESIQLVTVVENTGREAEGAVMILEGFAPIGREAGLLTYCEQNDILFLSERPSPEDQPPVLLKNSAFSRLFEPIGELFALPSYRELDLTPFFAPFFMMFFGFCLGDAGYGLVVLLGATLYKFRAKPEYKPILTLAQFLGVGTIIFGTLTGTFFGANLLDEQFAWLGGIRNLMIDSSQAFNLALILGLVQILFGLFLQAYNKARQFGPAYAVATIGWVVLLLSILDIAVLNVTARLSTYTAWLGVGMILFFNDPKAGLLSRLGKGVWELYGITGFFGDLLSYIRLFALGISSAILGFVVNDISLQIKEGIPYLGPVLFVVFLIVGHGANLLISSLGSFVHPLRLTFVEFYKSAGFRGGGKAYRPFSKPSEKS